MLVAMYYNNRDIRIQNVPTPEIGADEFLLKVMASGICGSDVTEWYRIPTAPKVLGHEATGVVEKTGKNVTNVKVGDRVFVSHHVPCNNCHYCLAGHHTACETLHTTNYYPGGLAQHVRVPKINVERGVYKLPQNMSFEEGTFIEPLACVVRGQRLSALRQQDTLLIIGGGLTGILHTQMAKSKGLRNIIVAEVDPQRLSLAEKFGAHHAIDAKENVPQELKKLNEGRLADQVILCSGATQAALTALKCVDRGGTILFFAVPDPTERVTVPITDFWRKEVTLKTSYGAAPQDLEESLAILKQKKVNLTGMVTHRLNIQETAEGFRLVATGGKSLKVIIEPNRN